MNVTYLISTKKNKLWKQIYITLNNVQKKAPDMGWIALKACFSTKWRYVNNTCAVDFLLERKQKISDPNGYVHDHIGNIKPQTMSVLLFCAVRVKHNNNQQGDDYEVQHIIIG